MDEVDLDVRLADMPIMAQRNDQIEALVFNVWRRARRRWGSPIRFNDLGLKQMAMVLADEYWVCVDTYQYDCPVLAWVEIEDEGRDSLHEPIACKLNYYHFAASALRGKVLAAIERVLAEKLREA